jgi:hypothetical protein
MEKLMDKHVNDVRASSSDSRYSNAGFVGLMDEAIQQAKLAPEFPLPEQPVKFKSSYKTTKGMSRDRYNLLSFLGLLR